MEIRTIKNLEKNKLYIVSVSNTKTDDLYSKIIKNICAYVSNNPKCVMAHHNALLVYNNAKRRWFISEVGYNGLESYEFIFCESKEFYLSEVGSITSKEKNYIFKKYHKKPLTNSLVKKLFSITSVIFGYPYPFLKAISSIELPVNLSVLSIPANYVLDLVRDIQLFVLVSILKVKPSAFCTESVLDTIHEINTIRKQIGMKELYLSHSLYSLIINQGSKFYEIYPQEIFDTMDHFMLVSNNQKF